MKIFIVSIFFIGSIFAHNAYDNNAIGKIDMHGGKGDKLMLPKIKNLNNLNMMQMGLPKNPNKPKKIEIERNKEEKTK